MRVLYFHQHFSTRDGATGTRSYEFARRLVERGHRVVMVCGSYGSACSGLSGEFIGGKRRGIVDGIDVIELQLEYSNHLSLARRSLVFARFAARSIGIALREPADLVFATSTPLTAGIPGIAARWLRRRVFIFEVRDLWPDLPRQMGVIKNRMVLALLSLLERASYGSATACIGLAPGIVAGIRRTSRSGMPVAMIPNGCDLDLFEPIADAAKPERPIRAVFAGTHGIANGLSAVLDAAVVLKARGRTDIRIELVGDGALKPALRDRAVAEDLDNCVFIDPIPKRRLAVELASAHAGMQILANVEGFYNATSPNKFFDYLACGLPVVTNYPGWVADMIDEFDCGIAVPPGDPTAFADALQFLADNPIRRAAMGSNARRLAESKFDRDALADQFVGLIEECRTR